MPNFLLGLVALVSGPLALASIVLAIIAGIAILVGFYVAYRQEGAVGEPGKDRDDLLAELCAGGDWRQFYVRAITGTLNRIDRLLGDADQPRPSLPWPFYNRTPAPYWTASSFDRWALVTMAYPFVTMYSVWITTGYSDEIGALLRLPQNPSNMVKLYFGIIPVPVLIGLFLYFRSPIAQSLPWLILAAVAAICGAISLVIWSHGSQGYSEVAGSIAAALAGIGAIAAAGRFAAAGAVAVAGAASGAVAGAGALALARCIDAGDVATVVLAAIGAVGGVATTAFYVGKLTDRAILLGSLGCFWLVFWPIAIFVTLGSIFAIGTFVPRPGGVLFLVLLLLIPLLNLPLDWASLGLTRALLRRGCEAGARSPLLLGLVDFIAGLVLLLLLAALLVVGLQLADWVYLKASGRILLDVPGRLRAIGADPGAPVHYWIYLTLFSTVIPSVVNTVVGMSSLVTWSWRGRREWLLATIPTINNPDKLPRTKFDILTLLGVQASIGTFTALAALYGVFELGRFLLPDALPGFLRLMLWLAESLPP